MDISNNDVASSPVAPGGRRKSGRAVKIPEKFVPDAPSSQTGSAASKRKRPEEEDENDASDIDELAEASEEEVESAAEEEIQEARRRAKKSKSKSKPQPKKPAAKKPKVNGDTQNEEPLAVKLPARPKKSGKRVTIADEDAEGLYGAPFYTLYATEPCLYFPS